MCVRDIFHCWNLMQLQSSRLIQLMKVVAIHQILWCRAALCTKSHHAKIIFCRQRLSFCQWCFLRSLRCGWLRGSTCNMWMFPRAKGGPEAKLSLGEKTVSKRRIAIFIYLHPSFTFDLGKTLSTINISKFIVVSLQDSTSVCAPTTPNHCSSSQILGPAHPAIAGLVQQDSDIQRVTHIAENCLRRMLRQELVCRFWTLCEHPWWEQGIDGMKIEGIWNLQKSNETFIVHVGSSWHVVFTSKSISAWPTGGKTPRPGGFPPEEALQRSIPINSRRNWIWLQWPWGTYGEHGKWTTASTSADDWMHLDGYYWFGQDLEAQETCTKHYETMKLSFRGIPEGNLSDET